ncbi:MAG: hypothetical protein RLZZ628_3506 [Bacteroidota bacterium]
MWKFLIVTCLCLPTCLFAQYHPSFSNDYHSFWGRWMWTFRTKHVNYAVEGVFRQQENEFAPQGWAGHNAPLAVPLVRGLRVAAQYNVSKHWRLDAGTSWFWTHPVIRKATDLDKPIYNDIRITIMPNYTFKTKKFEFNNKLGVETFFISPRHFDSVSVRPYIQERPTFKYQFAPHWWASVYDEFWVDTQTWKYNQHRPAGMLHFQLNGNTVLEGGVFMTYRPNDPTYGVTWMFYCNQVF